MKRPLCAAPFIGYYWKGNQSEDQSYAGRLRPCCEARPVRDQHGRILIKRSAKVEDVNQNLIEHEFLQEVRESLIEGEFHDICHDCEYREEKGLVSSREVYNSHARIAEELYPEMEYSVEKGNSLGKIFYLDYRPSNLCNLKCRMCSPYNSSLFAEEILNIQNLGEFNEYQKGTKIKLRKDDIYDKNATEKLHEILNLDDILYLKFLGGEPLFMKEPIEMMQKVGKNAQIAFTTNATKVSDDFINKAKNLDIKKLQIGLSLDGIEDVYEYIRYPGNWKRTERNIEKLFELQKDSKAEIFIAMTFVCQLWNAYQIPDMIRWSHAFYKRFYPQDHTNRGPYMSQVNQPELRLSNLDEDDKAWLMSELYKVSQELELSEKEFRKYIKTIMIQLEDDPTDQRLYDFKVATKTFDKFRNQDIMTLDDRFGKYMV